jgi:hypothetical protein
MSLRAKTFNHILGDIEMKRLIRPFSNKTLFRVSVTTLTALAIGGAALPAAADDHVASPTTTGQAQAMTVAAPMAKCIPGTGNPWNPCPRS